MNFVAFPGFSHVKGFYSGGVTPAFVYLAFFYFLKEVRTEFEIPQGQGRLGQNLNNDQNDCH